MDFKKIKTSRELTAFLVDILKNYNWTKFPIPADTYQYRYWITNTYNYFAPELFCTLNYFVTALEDMYR